MISKILKYFFIVIGFLTTLTIFGFLGFYGAFYYQYNKDVKNGVYSISKAKKEVLSNIDKAIKTTAFCDYNPNSENPNCVQSEIDLENSSIALLNLNSLVKNQCPEYIAENVEGQIHGLLVLFSFSYYERNLRSLQFYNDNMYEAVTQTVEDLILFDFKTNCPDSIEKEGQTEFL